MLKGRDSKIVSILAMSNKHKKEALGKVQESQFSLNSSMWENGIMTVRQDKDFKFYQMGISMMVSLQMGREMGNLEWRR